MVSTPQQQSTGASIRERTLAGVRILRNNPPAAVGLILVLFYVFIAAAGPNIAPHPYDKFAVGPPLEAPSLDHPFGTDEFGRDVFSRVLYRGRISFRVGALVSGGRQYVQAAWWIPIFPGFAIFGAVLAFNLLGDALRDALDPRLRHLLQVVRR